MAHDKQNITRYAVIPATLTPFAVLFQFGFSVGTINSFSGIFKAHHLNLHDGNNTQNSSTADTEYFETTLLPLLASCLPLGAVAGSFFSNPLMTKFGKRNALIYLQLLVLISVVLSSLSKLQKHLMTLYIGQFVVGVYTGIANAIGPVYVAEIAPKQIRGIFGGLFSVFISVGVLTGNILGLPQIFGNAEMWQYQFICAAIPAIIYVSAQAFLPKSPRSAFLIEKDRNKSVEILLYLRRSDVKSEIDELQEEANNLSQIEQMSIWKLVNSRDLRWQFITAMVILSTTSLTGFNALQYYLNDVFKMAQIPLPIIPYISIGILSFQTFYSVLTSFFSDRVGRRILLLIGTSMMLISWTIFTICLRYSDTRWVSYIAVVCALGVILGFCTGLGIIAFTIIPEIFEQSSRGAAMSLGITAYWISSVIVAYATPYLQKQLNYLAFVPYLIISAGTTAYVYIIVPETKKKTFFEITREFEKLNNSKWLNCR